MRSKTESTTATVLVPDCLLRVSNTVRSPFHMAPVSASCTPSCTSAISSRRMLRPVWSRTMIARSSSTDSTRPLMRSV